MQKLSAPRIAAHLALCVAIAGASSARAESPDGERFFEERVRPILVGRCVECHGGKKQQNGLRLDARSMMLQGGDSGPAIVVGKPSESLLVEAIRREGLEMPPDEPLSDAEIETLEKWIRLGAPWPASDTPPTPALGDQRQIRAAAKQHWSFQPLLKPKPPASGALGWVQTPVDAFVLARLRGAGLEPSPPADRRTLIRRAYYDVIGLPPSYDEIQAFVNDPSPNAFEKVVDFLLDSANYGERWGRYWLDIARYADTAEWQSQTDVRYPFAYTYRDWVINALNEDMPYDEFIEQQIAADFYTQNVNSPSLAALGFLTVGRRFRNNSFEQVADRVDLVTRGLMALTVGCARCHDHKYDPVPTADYYSLAGVFASCETPEELPVIRGGEPVKELLEDYRHKHDEKVKDLRDYIDGLVRDASRDFRQRIAVYFTGYFEMKIGKKSDIRSVVQKLKVKETAMTPLADNLDRMLRDRKASGDRVWGPWVRLLKLPNNEFARTAGGVIQEIEATENQFNPLIVKALRERPPKDKQQLLDVYAGLFNSAEEKWQQITADSQDVTQLDDGPLEEIRRTLYGDSGPFAFKPDAVEEASRLQGPGRVKLGKLYTAISEVDVTHPGAPRRAMVVVDKKQLFNPYVMLRGEPQRRGPNVPRRFVSIVAGDDAPAFSEGSGRRELAEAIVAPDNPLTPRVMVNRVWMKLLGNGFVSTADDFGLRCESPSHPQLLDYLAATFIEDGWSLKKLVHQILLSAVYQQASENRDDAAGIDPENRLLWRANRKRLDFEATRDSILAASGRIDLAIGGRSEHLSERPFTTRRTLYGYIDRVDTDPIFKIFDAASPDASSPSRAQTTVPQQALFMMNNPFVIEQARALAALATAGAGDDLNARIDRLYRRLFGRDADEQEQTLAARFIDQSPPAASPEQAVWQYGYGSFNSPADGAHRFTPLAHWTGRQYQFSEQLPDPTHGPLRLTNSGGVPGRDKTMAAIRRWISPINGVVSLEGTLKHTGSKGDGIRARIVAADGSVLGEWDVFQQEVATSVRRLKVQRGEPVDFIVDCKANSNADSFTWAPVIRERDREHEGDVWNARKQFTGPPPPPLDAWEQLAQALMITNEYWFVD